MPLAGKGMLLTSMDIDPSNEAEFNRWYAREHLDERAGWVARSDTHLMGFARAQHILRAHFDSAVTLILEMNLPASSRTSICHSGADCRSLAMSRATSANIPAASR